MVSIMHIHKQRIVKIYIIMGDYQYHKLDKIWDRNPSKLGVIGRCGGDEKTNDHAEPTKVER